jgi:urea transporter
LLIFGREPALWIALLGVALKLACAFWIDFSVDQQAVINAVIVAAFGCIVAFLTRDGQSAGILGFVQALIALSLGFGFKLTPENQAIIMSAVATTIAMFVRTQVLAPVPAPPVT